MSLLKHQSKWAPVALACGLCKHNEVLRRGRDASRFKARLPAAGSYQAAEQLSSTFSIGALQALQLALAEQSA